VAGNKAKSNTVRKATRARSWARGQERKAARRERQAAAAKHNKEDGTTPWLISKWARAERRESQAKKNRSGK